jgi:hypothetical protein
MMELWSLGTAQVELESSNRFSYGIGDEKNLMTLLTEKS